MYAACATCLGCDESKALASRPRITMRWPPRRKQQRKAKYSQWVNVYKLPPHRLDVSSCQDSALVLLGISPWVEVRIISGSDLQYPDPFSINKHCLLPFLLRAFPVPSLLIPFVSTFVVRKVGFPTGHVIRSSSLVISQHAQGFVVSNSGRKIFSVAFSRMASPEIKLPAGSKEANPGQKEEERRFKALESKKYDGNDFERSSYSKRLPDENAIIYHYLTFETPLPDPSTFEVNGSNGPELPDLKDCVSPFTWSESRKTFTTWLSCAITVVTAYTAGSYSPPAAQMMAYWDVSQVAILVGITTFTTGFAIAPMVLAPFSELNGRKPVFIATGVLFVVCQLCCAVTRSYPGMLVARFFAGVGGSTFSTMVGGVVSDIYHTQGLCRLIDLQIFYEWLTSRRSKHPYGSLLRSSALWDRSWSSLLRFHSPTYLMAVGFLRANHRLRSPHLDGGRVLQRDPWQRSSEPKSEASQSLVRSQRKGRSHGLPNANRLRENRKPKDQMEGQVG